MQAMEISRTAMDVEWRRLEVIAENLANVNSTRGADGTPYRAMRLLSGPKADFASHLGAAQAGVAVLGVEAQEVPLRQVYEPSHPDADSAGYVAYPGVDHAAEMALMVKTSRAYEANIVAMKAARQMYLKALELGKR